MALNKPLTIEDFEEFVALPENRDRLLEFINGEIVEKLPAQLHAFIVGLLAKYFGIYLDLHPIGWALPEAHYQLEGDDFSPIPDFSFVLREGKTLTTKGAAPYMPELAVEIQSPDDSQAKMERKKDAYLGRGTKIVWLIYPKARRVGVFTPDDEKRELTDGDTLTVDDLLPGLEIKVSKLFDVM
jgi:Uma2 family endonuclease